MRTVQFSTLLGLLVGAAAVGCSSDGPTAPTTGGVQVSVTVTGPDVDANGFTVVIDGSSSKTVAAGGQATFTGLSAGQHSLLIQDVADNCQVVGGDMTTATVTAGQNVSTLFSVSCNAVVTGNWSYSADFALSGVPCTLTESLSMSQAGSSFSGIATNTWIVCPLAGIDEAGPNAAIVNGVTNQFNVVYDFDNSNIHHTGTYATTVMNGSVTIFLDSGLVTGTWTAARSGGAVIAGRAVAPAGELPGLQVRDPEASAAMLEDIARRLRQ